MLRSLNRRHNLQVYFFVFLAYLLPLGCIFLMEKTAFGQISTVNFILFGIEAASPSIAAIIVVFVFEKKTGVKEFFCFNFSQKLTITSVAVSIMIAFAIMITAKGISCLILGNAFKMADLTSNQIVVIGWAFVAEEIGWRGFLTKKLSASFSPLLTPLFVGLIWAFWHYHFFIINSIDVSVPLFIAGCVVDSYLYVVLLKITGGNILIAMFYHMASNFFINLFLINPDVNGGSHVPYVAYVIVSAIFVIGIIAVNKYRTCKKME